MELQRKVTDETGAIHSLVRCLGQGGQGEVWLTANGRRVVKLFPGNSKREELRRQIAFVKRADLGGLHVARPLALLREPAVGYVAEFLEDMIPMRALLAPARGESIRDWYLATGGLRRRLRLLAHAGEAVAGVHSRGLVYGDISDNNIFVSAPTDAEEAWLIDLDNLKYESDPLAAIFTRSYGAPEVISRSTGLTSFSDAWAFGVLAFQVLTLVHPFLGDMVADGEPELEDDAFSGHLPWIEDATDTRNTSSRGLPRNAVVGREVLDAKGQRKTNLFEVARRTFEEGRLDPQRRPGVSSWVESLHVAADQTVRCPDCSATFFVTAPKCRWCGAVRPAMSQVRFQRWDPASGVVPAMGNLARIPLVSEVVELPRRLTHAESGVGARSVAATLEPTDRGVILRAAGTCWVSDPADPRAKRPLEVTERGRVLPLGPIESSWVVHFGPVNEPHRIAVMGVAK